MLTTGTMKFECLKKFVAHSFMKFAFKFAECSPRRLSKYELKSSSFLSSQGALRRYLLRLYKFHSFYLQNPLWSHLWYLKWQEWSALLSRRAFLKLQQNLSYLACQKGRFIRLKEWSNALVCCFLSRSLKNLPFKKFTNFLAFLTLSSFSSKMSW